MYPFDNHFSYDGIKLPDIEAPEFDDGESPYELLQRQAQSSEKQREILEQQIPPLKEIAEAAKLQASVAEKTANRADIKGWLAIAISIFALIIEIFLNRAEIITFLQSLFQQTK